MAREYKNVRQVSAAKKRTAKAPAEQTSRFGAALLENDFNSDGSYMNDKGEVRIEMTLSGSATVDRPMLKRYKDLGARVDQDESDDIDVVMWIPREAREKALREFQMRDIMNQQGRFGKEGLENERFEKGNAVTKEDLEGMLADDTLGPNDLAQL